MIAVSFVNKRLAPDFSLLENCYGTTSKQNGKAYSTRELQVILHWSFFTHTTNNGMLRTLFQKMQYCDGFFFLAKRT